MNTRTLVSRLIVAGSLAVTVAPAAAQHSAPYRPTTAVVPQTITVGDVFQAAIRLEIPADATVSFPDSLALPANVEVAGRRDVHVDSTAAGNRVYTAVYPLTAWQPGSVSLPGATVLVRAGRGDATVDASFPEFSIESVLPADTASIEPKPAKDVLGANRVWWPIVLGAALLLAVLVLAYVWYRRRQPAPEAPPIEPAVPPRALALERLEHARSLHLVEAGQVKEFYSLVSDALRGYLNALDGRWTADLTTTELAGVMRGKGIDAEAAALLGLLGSADLVKFARRRPVAPEAYGEWSVARGWVESFDWPPRVTVPEAKAA
ncbi:MAG: hypothetical protein ACRELX_11470 [Longimicrobiales bacterium]